MKAYFASFTDLGLRPVDAHVQTAEEAATILDALRVRYADHELMLRARLKSGAHFEARYIGLGSGADSFIEEVRSGKLPLKES
jgi:hypothetical protein